MLTSMGTYNGRFLDLPYIVIEKIFSFLTYDELSQNRLVCQRFNEISGDLLNKGFVVAEKFHGKTLRSIKAKLPRRESERRTHPLARQCDILIAIETRLSMLTMTYSKWIEAKLCCFIPGKVIDEIMKILRDIAENPNPPRAHEILQELRDISSMAMEHFDEKILPSLKTSLHCPAYNALDIKGQKCILEYCSGRDLPRPTVTKVLEGIQIFNKPDRITSQRQMLLDTVRDRLYTPSQSCKRSLAGSSSSPSSGGCVLSEIKKIVLREAINRRNIKMQNEMINKQAAEISELRRHIEEWETKWRDLITNLKKSQDLPSTSAESPPEDHVPMKRALSIDEETVLTKKMKAKLN